MSEARTWSRDGAGAAWGASPPPVAASKRARATRRALLEGAAEVFAERGFEGATVAEIVERSGSSVGSLYNLVGGKPDLFLALYEEFSALAWDATRRAMAEAADAGSDPLAVYVAGARAYLLASWEHRRLAGLFVSGDGPPGFAAAQREHQHRWTRQVLEALGEGTPFGEVLVGAVNGVIGSGARHLVGRCASDGEAAEVVEYVLVLVTRLAAPEAAGHATATATATAPGTASAGG